MTLGEKIKRLRNEKGYSQEELGRLTMISGARQDSCSMPF
jgi:transcriptional regulator with XRE-family HTH domain